jgi:hypothetical protein
MYRHWIASFRAGLSRAGIFHARGRTATAALLLVLAIAVAARSTHGSRPALDAAAREYVRLAVGLGERDPDSLDFYAGSAAVVADVRQNPPSLQSIKRSVEGAISRLENRESAADQQPRRQRLIRELRALRARVDVLLGGRPPYDVESRALFGIAPGPPADRRFAEIRARVDALLPGPGRLVDRYAAYDARFTVPSDRLQTVFERALAECRRRTLVHVPLPSDERVTVEFVRNRPWSAYSRYLGGARSVVSVNVDFRFTADRLLQVACHEGYPGHHVGNTLMDAWAASRGGLEEYTIRPLFSPQTLIAEGSAMYAVDVAFSDDDRVRFEREQLFPAAGITGEDAGRYVRVARLVEELQDVQVEIARQYLDGALEFARAAAALEEQALMRDTGAMLKYVNEFRSYVTAYTTGRQAAVAFVESCAGSADRDRRWKCFERLLTAGSDDLIEVLASRFSPRVPRVLR